MSYTQFKHEMETELLKAFDKNTINRITFIMDRVARGYSVETACTALSTKVCTMPNEMNLYLASCKLEGMAQTTIQRKMYLLRAMFACVNKPLNEITTNDVRAFLYSYQEERHISDRSLDGMRTIVSAFYTWLVDNDYAPKNIVRPIKKIKYESKQREHLTQYELEQLRAACRTERERALVEFLYSTGCRIGEAAGVKLTDIDFGACEVKLFGKGKKHRISYLNPKSILAINAYLKTLKFVPVNLFNSERRPYRAVSGETLELIMHKIVSRIEGGTAKHITPHVIRHTTATQALSAGMPITQIQRLLGHESVATTQIYAETNQDDVRRSHERCVV